ncbi:MAG TPA: hypothetical protein VL500_02210 [Candidatus Eisenbacteria bacterium]|nr:hypothetical protein [Candidatus Eisenbacteria bacterium]
METASQNNDAAGPMSPATLDELRMLVYHPRHASDPERPLRYARRLLSRPRLAHATLGALPEADAVLLIAALREEFPDRSAGIASRVKKDMLGRPD